MKKAIVRVFLGVLLWVSVTFPRPPGAHSAAYWEGGPAPVRRSDAVAPAPELPPAALPAPQSDDEDLLDPTPILVRPYVLLAEQERAARQAEEDDVRQVQQARIDSQLEAERALRAERLATRRRLALLKATGGYDYPEPLRGAAALA